MGRDRLSTPRCGRPEERMKMGKAHAVPFPMRRFAILRAQERRKERNPHLPRRPMRPLSNMAMRW